MSDSMAVGGDDGVVRSVIRRGGWWSVWTMENGSLVCLSGGFHLRAEAVAEAKRLGSVTP